MINNLFPQLVFDDIIESQANTIQSWYTRLSHHLNASVICLVQNLFDKQIRTISVNSSYLIVFRNPRDQSSIKILASQIYPHYTEFLYDAYTRATRAPHGYLVIDLNQQTPEELRFRHSVFSKDAHFYISTKTRSRWPIRLTAEEEQEKIGPLASEGGRDQKLIKKTPN